MTAIVRWKSLERSSFEKLRKSGLCCGDTRAIYTVYKNFISQIFKLVAKKSSVSIKINRITIDS